MNPTPRHKRDPFAEWEAQRKANVLDEKAGTFTLKGVRYRYSATQLRADDDRPERWQINVHGPNAVLPDTFQTGPTFKDVLTQAKAALR